MKFTVQPIGGFFEQDANGYVINPASTGKILPPWDGVIEQIKDSYIRHLGDRVHSIYVRGSVARGLAVENFSDVDTFALIHPADDEYVWWEDAPWTGELYKQVTSSLPFGIRKTELMLCTYSNDFIERHPGMAMVIKTQSACIYGNDISPRIKAFKPGREMMLEYSHIEENAQKLRALMATGDEDLIRKKLQSLMKAVLRAAFELVMEREGKYTNNLYYCYTSFAKHYPARAAEMYTALETYVNPVADKELITRLLENVVMWLVQEINERLGETR